MLKQIFYSPDKSYQLEYPRVWEMEMNNSIPAFFEPFNGKGALQILSLNADDFLSNPDLVRVYPYMAGKTIEDKMIIFLHMQDIEPKDGDLAKYTKKNMIYVPYEYSREDRFYMSVMMQRSSRFLLVIYNSSPAPDEEEAKIIGEIISSIEITEEF
jgi:hypothetical protein